MNPLEYNIREILKAVVAGVVMLVGSLLLVMQGNETFADVTIVEWLTVVGNVLGGFGFTFYIPNQQQTEAIADRLRATP